MTRRIANAAAWSAFIGATAENRTTSPARPSSERTAPAISADAMEISPAAVSPASRLTASPSSSVARARPRSPVARKPEPKRVAASQMRASTILVMT